VVHDVLWVIFREVPTDLWFDRFFWPVFPDFQAHFYLAGRIGFFPDFEMGGRDDPAVLSRILKACSKYTSNGSICSAMFRLSSSILRTYHEDGIHDSLEKDAPDKRPIEPKPGVTAAVTSMPRLGGLHHRNAWREAA
jgi:hypothetical protein